MTAALRRGGIGLLVFAATSGVGLYLILSTPSQATMHSVIAVVPSRPDPQVVDRESDPSANPLLRFGPALDDAASRITRLLEDRANPTTIPQLADSRSRLELRNNSSLGQAQAASPFIEIIGRGPDLTSATAVVEQATSYAQSGAAAEVAGQQRSFQIETVVDASPSPGYERNLWLALGGLISVAVALALIGSSLIKPTPSMPGNLGSRTDLTPTPASWQAKNFLVIVSLAAFLVPAGLVIRGLPFSLTPGAILALACGGTAITYQFWKAVRARSKHSDTYEPVPAAYKIAVAVVTLSIASTTISMLARYSATDETHASFRSIIYLASGLSISLACVIGLSIGAAEKLLRYVCCLIALFAAVGLLQAAGGLDLAQTVGRFPLLRPSTEVLSVISRADLRRPAGTAAHPIEFGMVCAVGFILSLGFLSRAVETYRRVFWTAVCTISLVGAITSLSRSAILAIIIGLLVLALLGSILARAALALGAMIAFFGTAAELPQFEAIRDLFTDITSDSSVAGRLRDYDDAYFQFVTYPWLGRGYGTRIAPKYNILDNQFLKSALETGIVGLVALGLLLVVTVIVVLRAAVRKIRSPQEPSRTSNEATIAAAIIAISVSFATFDGFSFQMITILLFLLIGCAHRFASTRVERKTRNPVPSIKNEPVEVGQL